MNTTDEIIGYVDEVRAALADLPADARSDLTDDLPEHLAEVLAEGEGSLVDRLGTPQAYAAELRAASGLVGGVLGPPQGTTGRLRADAARLRAAAARHLAAADTRLGPLLGYARASEFLLLLRPAWWVLRGYLAAMVVAWMLDDSGQPLGLMPRIGGSDVVALLLLAAGILGSIWLGRRPAPRAPLPRYALYSATVVLVLVAFAGFLSADSNTRTAGYQDVSYDNPYGGIEDVFVYDAEGRLVTGARLFDQNGQPIRLGAPVCRLRDEAEIEHFDGSGLDPFDDPKRLTYPYCSENAPFVVPIPGSPTPSAAQPEPTEAEPRPSVAPPSVAPRSVAPPTAPSGAAGPQESPSRPAPSPSPVRTSSSPVG